MTDWTVLNVRTDLEQDPWTDLRPESTANARLVGIGLLRHATVEGRAGVVLRVEVPVPGDPAPLVLMVETTWRLFHTAHRALAASPVIAEEDPG